MRVVLIAAVGAAALAGCSRSSVRWDKDDAGDTPLRVVTQLECPEHQGILTRVSTAADGLSCEYAGPQGADVTLKLIKLPQGQSAEDALKPIEAQLNALMPGVAVKLAQSNASSMHAQAQADAADEAGDRAAEAADRAQEAADRAREKAEEAADQARDRAEEAADRARERAEGAGDGDTDVRGPGMHINTHGDRSQVHLPGLRIDADAKGAHINIGGVHIEADDTGHGHGSGNVNITSDDGDVSIRAQDHAAEIRARKTGKGLRATFVLADDEAEASGWRLVGYEARGPSMGPVVVAIVKSRSRNDDPLFSAAKRLVIKNVG